MRLALTSQQEKASVTASSKMRCEENGLIFLCLVMVKDAASIFRLDRFHSSMASNPDMVKAITPQLHREPGMA
ncbi:hypothetical protein [uncultured Bacteroides sp.]|uniref:hypothetical protein n=1 Tax=uncultured Bacteroides sp. TaxID=162156 RepID=UPI0027D94A60|nr:hypothetical protein [uncultured Bacteroides sp.]